MTSGIHVDNQKRIFQKNTRCDTWRIVNGWTDTFPFTFTRLPLLTPSVPKWIVRVEYKVLINWMQ